MKFSPANAREMAARSAEARRNRHANEELAASILTLSPAQPATQAADPVANEFTCAMLETLREFRAAKDYREKASLARSMREVRETYHLYSGAPKPGTIKPERQSSRQQVRQPSEPQLDPGPDTTIGSGPSR